jgi:hypothetical protein
MDNPDRPDLRAGTLAIHRVSFHVPPESGPADYAAADPHADVGLLALDVMLG